MRGVLAEMSKLKDYLDNYWNYIGQYQGQPIVEIPDVGRDDLARWFGELGLSRGVEVGTERGEYAEVLCKANPKLRLWCVDPYEAYGDYREHTSQEKLDSFYEEAQQRMTPYGNCEFFRTRSTAAARGFSDKCLDFVYLDGNHSLPYVISDLHAWVPKVRKGGIVAGHDYIRRNNSLRYQCHVVEAVHAYTQCYMIKPLFIVGAKTTQSGIKRDAIRSWFFIKE